MSSLKRKAPLKAKAGGLKTTKPLTAKKGLNRTAASRRSTGKGLPSGSGLKRSSTLKATGSLKATGRLKAQGSLKATSTLKATSSLKATATLRSHSTLKATTKIKPNPKLAREAKKYHDEVFALFGDRCVLCTRRHPAVHAAHVLKKSMLGALRYADPRLARPAHADCHTKQEANQIRFSFSIRLDAVRAYNALVAKNKKNKPIPEPTE